MAAKETCVVIAVCMVCSALTAVVPYAPSPYAEHDEDEDGHLSEHEHDRQHHQHHHYHHQQQQQQRQRQQDDASSYSFEYAVHDPATGDVKSHNEASDGRGAVSGSYSLLEPDGSTRVVEYTADDVRGFVAVVKRIAPQHKAGEGAAPAYGGYDFLESEPSSSSSPAVLPQDDRPPERFPPHGAPESPERASSNYDRSSERQ